MSYESMKKCREEQTARRLAEEADPELQREKRNGVLLLAGLVLAGAAYQNADELKSLFSNNTDMTVHTQQAPTPAATSDITLSNGWGATIAKNKL